MSSVAQRKMARIVQNEPTSRTLSRSSLFLVLGPTNQASQPFLSEGLASWAQSPNSPSRRKDNGIKI